MSFVTELSNSEVGGDTRARRSLEARRSARFIRGVVVPCAGRARARFLRQLRPSVGQSMTGRSFRSPTASWPANQRSRNGPAAAAERWTAEHDYSGRVTMHRQTDATGRDRSTSRASQRPSLAQCLHSTMTLTVMWS